MTPSITLLQVVWPAPGVKPAIVRFRFLAPQIGPGEGQVDGDRAQDDMDLLCSAYALPEIKAHGGQVDQVVISLSQKPLASGTREPDVVQFFDAYDLGGGNCEWEGL